MIDQDSAVPLAEVLASESTESDGDNAATAPSPKTYLTPPDNHADAGVDVEF